MKRTRWSALALTVAALACGESPTPPEVEPEPPTATVEGTSWAKMFNGEAPLEFTAKNSSGVQEHRWWHEQPDGNLSEVMTGESYRFSSSQVGEHQVYFEGVGSNGETYDTSVVAVVEPEVTLSQRVRPLLYEVRDDQQVSIHAYDELLNKHERLFTVEHDQNGAGSPGNPGLSPDRSFLAFPRMLHGGSTTTFDLVNLATGEQETIVDLGGVTKRTAWHPSECIIAALTDTRVAGNRHDELVLAVNDRQDCSGEWYHVFPGGESTNPMYYGNRISWSPDGTKLVIAGTWVENSDGSGSRRVFIHENILSDEPTFRRLTSDEDWYNPAAIREEGGVSWSPDGERIAFSVDSGNDWDTYVTRVDGSIKPYKISDSGGPLSFSASGNYVFMSCLDFSTICDLDSIAYVHAGGGGRLREFKGDARIVNN